MSPEPVEPGPDTPAVQSKGYDEAFLGPLAPLPVVVGDRPVVRLDYAHFTVVLDLARRLAVTAAVNIDGAALLDLERGDDWHYDPRVPETGQVGEEVYARNDLDRGHLVRRRDPVWGTPTVAAQANFDSFAYTNAAPQAAVFNQSKDLWLGLEDYLLDAARAARARLSVITGPVLTAEDPAYRGAQIPRRFYKIAAWADVESGTDRDGTLAATGYVLDQSEQLDRIDLTTDATTQTTPRDLDLGAYRTYQVPVADVAQLAGLDVGPLAAADRLPALLGASKIQRTGGQAPGWRLLASTDDLII